MLSPKRTVTVFGSGTVGPTDPLYRTATELGRMIAESGWALCNGGYGGTMEAAARGAVEAGGHTIGVTCRAFGRSGPNEFIREEISTSDLLERLGTLVRLGDAYVVLDGGTGTLAELALVWEMANKRFLRPARSVYVLGTQWEPILEYVRRAQPGAVPIEMFEAVDALAGALRSTFRR